MGHVRRFKVTPTHVDPPSPLHLPDLFSKGAPRMTGFDPSDPRWVEARDLADKLLRLLEERAEYVERLGVE
jgi:hypothetical protein